MAGATALVRPEVLDLAPYNSGLTLAEVSNRYAPARIAKLGSNESPLGPGPRAIAAAGGAVGNFRLYPDPASLRLRAALGARFGVPGGRVMVGKGSEELLSIVSRAVVRPGDRVVTLYPSFPLHEDYAALMGAAVDRVEVRADLTVDVDELVAAASRPCRMVIFSNPMSCTPTSCRTSAGPHWPRFGALSADHLEHASEEGVGAMAAAGTVAVLLPGAYYFLREARRPPVDALRRHGARIAVATDCNPGTSPLASILAAANMAATLFRLTVEECLAGVTREAARALGLLHETGTLEPGKWCDLAIWDVERPAEMVCRIGPNPLHSRVWRGTHEAAR